MVGLLLSYICIVSFYCLVNGQPSADIKLGTELRKGDQLWPHLFLLCAKEFSPLISLTSMAKRIEGVMIYRRNPMVTHLFSTLIYLF